MAPQANEVVEVLKRQLAAYQDQLALEDVAALPEPIGEIISSGSIMNKSFYVVVPFQTVTVAGLASQPKGQSKTKTATGALQTNAEEQFNHAKTQLWQRMEFVALGLRRCGLKCVPLNSLELIEFFWGLHHPTESENGYYPQIPPELIQ